MTNKDPMLFLLTNFFQKNADYYIDSYSDSMKYSGEGGLESCPEANLVKTSNG